ncbi:hypothetical protein [Endothiovibrio diazotrophicus]
MNLRPLLLPLLLILLPLHAPPTFAAADSATTLHWLQQRLEREMSERAAGEWDWNLIASLLFPLARHQQRHPTAEDAAVLERAARRIDALDPGGLACGALTDRYLSGRFLEEAGFALQRQPERQRLAGCLAEAPRFDRANTLLLACRYGAPVEKPFIEQAAADLIAGQGEDGAFSDGGRSGYYLTTHAMLALHECGGHDAAVARAAGKLTRHLEPFLRQGFLDGLAESLIFLRWVGHPAADEARYRRALAQWTSADGGLCFAARPGCRAHWHATALWLELEDEAREDSPSKRMKKNDGRPTPSGG